MISKTISNLKFLLDTHTILWFLNGDSTLSKTAKSIIEDTSNHCSISIVSFWEMAIKISLGKLNINYSFTEMNDVLNANKFDILPISHIDCETIIDLPFHHRDPFDRMLITQAINNNMSLISKDEAFKNYEINLIW